MRVRKVHIDYEGDGDSPKPMALFLEPTVKDVADLERRACEAFTQFFPEWRLRRCHAESVDEHVDAEELTPLPGAPGVWVATRENAIVPNRAASS
jgi:hypothetical protein